MKRTDRLSAQSLERRCFANSVSFQIRRRMHVYRTNLFCVLSENRFILEFYFGTFKRYRVRLNALNNAEMTMPNVNLPNVNA